MTDQLIYESKKSKVFARTDAVTGKRVAVKILNYEFPTPKEIAQFHNEFDIISGLGIAGIRNVIRKTRENNRHILIMEWVDGQSLKDAFHLKQNDIVDALHISIAAAKALAGIHQHQIIHKDITPYNLIIDLQERKVHLIDFAISTNLRLKQPYVGNPEKIEGTLAYLSPEQTGRMNRSVDYRTDLYSLGVSLYEILAGQLPFPNLDPIEMVHAHLAQIPAPLNKLNPGVPQPLSDIIMRLLAKSADHRYQSASGLAHDLALCLENVLADTPDKEIVLKSRDHSSEFRLPERLYGREDEIHSIITTFESAAQGARELLLITGYSGAGKTSLVHESHSAITRRRGNYCSGKFDQFQRVAPYTAFLDAFQDLINTLLTYNESQLAAIREGIQKALGEEGKVLTNVLPNLEHLIGKQPDIPEVGGAEAQHRLHYVFRKFVRTLCQPKHPLVIFIDDLQWADSSSLDLLKVLLADPECSHLLIICAYRENEIDPTHPFIRTVDDLTEQGLSPRTIRVKQLLLSDIENLLSDALGSTAEKVRPLAQLVHKKTDGNAFFATRFLISLAEEQLLVFNYASLFWDWETEAIVRKNIADNVVDLMADKVRSLAKQTRETLKLAAGIGSRFDLDTLSRIAGKTPADTLEDLNSALREGLVLPLGGHDYQFSHDRIQQAVYSLIPPDQQSQVHLHIGTLLNERLTPDERESHLFDITNHLNLGRSLINLTTKQLELISFNLRAGKKAKLNSAFPAALRYFGTGIATLNGLADPWNEHYQLTLDLHTEAADAAYLNGEFERMEEWLSAVNSNAHTILEKVRPYEIRILALKAQNRFMESIETGLEVLRQLGEKFPRNPNLAHILQDLLVTRIALRGRSHQDLMDLPLMKKPEAKASMRIIADIMSSVYWGKPKLVPLLAFRLVRLSLKYGNHPVSCFAYGSYGVILCGVLGAMKKGYGFGKLALALLDKLDAKEWKAQIYVTPYALIFHWNEHVRNTLRPLQDSFQIGMETGLIEFACVNTNIYCIQAFLCGRPLERVEAETLAYSNLYRQFKQTTNLNYNEVFRQAMLNLMGRSTDPVLLVGDAYNEHEMAAQNLERSDKTGTFFIHFNKLILCYLFSHHEEAYEQARKSRKLLDAVLAKFEIPNHCFYEALALIALAGKSGAQQRIRMLWRARRNIAKLNKWSKTAPENYRHKFHLCRAELARVRNQPNQARLHYDLAITGASKTGYIHEQALAYELAGQFYAASDHLVLAEFHLKAAYNTYREWGAQAKTRDLAERFPKYLSRSHDFSSLNTQHFSPTTSMIDGSLLDMTSVLKASTTISGEVIPAKLLTVLMKIVLENAGAQRGLLFLDSEGSTYLEALAEDGGSSLEVMQHIMIENCVNFASPVVHFVRRSLEPVVINDARTDERTRSCDSRGTHQPKSILCIPILKQAKPIGILYLENNLTIGAFTRDRVDLLTLLSGQIAVSIDNALLYEQLEQKVRERTSELALEKQKTDDLLHNILPVATAEELKTHGFTKARHYKRATVLFTDFVGFTQLAARLEPEKLVAEINECFKEFDLIAERHGIEKIKTIGDAFMAAGGLPVQNSTHPENTIRAAIDIRDFMEKRNESHPDTLLNIRIGIHTGPVVAGIVGLKKFQYDIWGDTVNTAARLESASVPGKINVSQATHDLTANLFAFTARGEIEVKGKGHLHMFFVEPIKPSTVSAAS